MFKKRFLQEGEKTLKEKININTLFSLIFMYFFPMDRLARFKYINYKPAIKPAIYAVWHGWQYGIIAIRGSDRKNKLNILISQSNDGEAIAKVSHGLGYLTIRGSKKRGGTKALREMLAALKKGQTIAYTVDGPKGPIYKVQPGIVKAAQISQAPIIPFVPYSRKFFEAKSWDTYKLPMISAKIAVAFGDPIYVPRDIDENEAENYRLAVENELHRLNEVAKEAYYSK